MKKFFLSLGIFLALGLCLVYSSQIEAKSVTATSGQKNLYFGSGGVTNINTTSFSTTYAAEIRNASTNALIPEGGAVPIGSTIKLIAYTDQPISWSGTIPSGSKSGGGLWVTNAAPISDSVSFACGWDYIGIYSYSSSANAYSQICSNGYTYKYYMTASIHPINATVSTTGNMSCGALVVNVATCVVNGTGPLSATFYFPNTYGKFYKDYHVSSYGCISGIEPNGCYAGQYPLNGATVPLSAQSISYTLTAVPVDGVCAATHYACTKGNSIDNVSGTSWTWTCQGLGGGRNDPCSEAAPNLTPSAPTPNTVAIGVPQAFISTITNNGTASTGTSFNNFFRVATAPNGGGTVSTISVTSRGLLAADTSGDVTSSDYTFNSTGTYSVQVCTDNNASFVGAIAESNEGDNCSDWINVTVSRDLCLNFEDVQTTIPTGLHRDTRGDCVCGS